MRTLSCFLLLVGLTAGQSASDTKIQAEFQDVMALAAPPKGGGTMSEKEAKARADRFRASLKAFIETWKPRAKALDLGRFTLARALAVAGKPGLAIPALRGFLKDHPQSDDAEEAWLSLGAAYLDTGKPATAAGIYQRFLKERGTSDRRYVATYYLGLARYALGERDAALELVGSVARSGIPDRLVVDAGIKYVELLRNSGRVKEARDVLSGLRAKNPKAPYLKLLSEQLDWIGREAPELKNVSAWIPVPPPALKSLRGQVVVLTFFVNWAGASRDELKALTRTKRELSGRGVVFLALTKFYVPFSKQSREAQVEAEKSLLTKLGVTIITGIADDFSNLKAYGVRGVPETVVIGKDGRVSYMVYGASRHNARGQADLKDALLRALK